MKRKDKGLTLFEMVTIIVVMGLVIPVLLNMWADVARRSGRSESIAEAGFYAEELMEEIKSKRFDNNDASPWTPAASFGTDAGENRNDRRTFNDVDDFVGCTDPTVTTPATGYTRSVTVNYVTLSGSTWVSSGTSTDFKRIRVTVSRNDHLANDVSLITIVAAY